MSHDHHHHDHHNIDKETSSFRLLVSFLVNLIIALAEIIGGILSNSLALVSDAIHNLSDTISIFIAYLAIKVGKKPSNNRKTFGYKRIEILAALFNSATLFGICLFLIYQSVLRFFDQEKIDSDTMLIVAVIGLLGNLTAMILLNRDKSKNINIKAAYLHLLGDTISSVAVVAGAILIKFYNIFWIDALITCAISLYILKETYEILKQVYSILMQSTPSGINIEEIKSRLEQIAGIENIHHIHIWNLTDSQIHFECHVDFCNDLLLSEADALREKINEILHHEFDIDHITIQVEYKHCTDISLINKTESL